MKNTTELTTANVTNILNWYALEGQGNWGTWGKYPSLPVGANYHSFDTCHLCLTFDKMVTFGGNEFNCITDGRNAPGKNLITISISELVRICKSQGVEFANEYMTSEKANELAAARLNDAKKTVIDFEKMATYEFQEPQVRAQIESALSNVVVNKVAGSPISERIEGYEVVITNYCEKEQATFIVDLTLKLKNSRKTAGTYTASNVNIEEAVARFTNERVAAYSANLARHRDTLAKMQ